MIQEIRWVIAFRLIEFIMWVMPNSEVKRVFCVAIQHWIKVAISMNEGMSTKEAILNEIKD